MTGWGRRAGSDYRPRSMLSGAQKRREGRRSGGENVKKTTRRAQNSKNCEYRGSRWMNKGREHVGAEESAQNDELQSEWLSIYSGAVSTLCTLACTPPDVRFHPGALLGRVRDRKKVSRSPHWKDSDCGLHGIKQETVREFLRGRARSPWHFSLFPSCVAAPILQKTNIQLDHS